MKFVRSKGYLKQNSIIFIFVFTKKVRIRARAGSKLEDFLRLKFSAAELARRRNQIFSSLVKTYEKLKKLGFIYYNEQVVFLDETIGSKIQ